MPEPLPLNVRLSVKSGVTGEFIGTISPYGQPVQGKFTLTATSGLPANREGKFTISVIIDALNADGTPNNAELNGIRVRVSDR